VFQKREQNEQHEHGVHVAQSAPSSGTPEFTSVIYGVHVAHSAPSSGTPEFTSVIYGVHVAQSE
jgi:hypothetical protein